MLSSLAIAAMSALVFMARPVQSTNITVYPAPTFVPFLHLDLKIAQSTFAIEDNGVKTGQANNQGGVFYGNFTGDVLKMGAEFETYPAAKNGTFCTYENVMTLNTTDGVTMLMGISGHIHFAEPHLVGLTKIDFRTSHPKYQYLSFGDYYAQFAAIYPNGGKVSVDVFDIKTGVVF